MSNSIITSSKEEYGAAPSTLQDNQNNQTHPINDGKHSTLKSRTSSFDSSNSASSTIHSNGPQQSLRVKEVMESLHSSFQRFNGRQHQKTILVQALHRCQQQYKEFMIITGPSGVGKTCLALSLTTQQHHYHETAASKSISSMGPRSNQIFITMKFDQYPQNEKPFHLLSAFDGLIRILQNQDKLPELQNKIKLAMAPSEQRVLIECIPSLERLLDPEDSVTVNEMKRQELQKRFYQSFIKFLRILSDPNKHPLVLYVDDLQWSDKGSLELLLAIFSEDEPIHGLLLLGTCRSDEVKFDSLLSQTLRDLEDKHNTHINEIRLTNMEPDSITQIMGEVLQLGDSMVKPLAEILWHHTEGNCLFVAQLVKKLLEKRLIYVDATSLEWTWKDVDEIRGRIDNINIVQLLADKIQHLPEDVQHVISVAACLGPEIDEDLLYAIVDSVDVSEAIMIAIEEGILIHSQIPSSSRSMKPRWHHDRIQQAAYSLIPNKPIFHEMVGTVLHRNLSEEELEEHLFLVVNQLRLANMFQLVQDNRNLIAELCLRAGRKAISRAAFGMASDYFQYGIHMLDSKHCWKNQYNLSLALYNAAAEAEYVVANFEQMDLMIDRVLTKAHCFSDQLQVHCTRVNALGARNEIQRALDAGIGVLRKQGVVSFPSRPSGIRVGLAVQGINMKLSGLSDNYILGLPVMTDPASLAAMRLLHVLSFYTFVARDKCSPLVSIRQIQLTLKKGMSGISATAFSVYGMLIAGITKDIDEGYRFGQLALRIVEKYHAVEYIPRVYVVVYGILQAFKRPVREGIDAVLYGQKIAFETGDMEFAMVNGSIACFLMLSAGQPLPEVRAAMEVLLQQQKEHRQCAIEGPLRPRYQEVLNLMGVTEDPINFYCEETVTDGATILAYLEAQIETGYIMHELHYARQACNKAIPIINRGCIHPGLLQAFFYDALIWLAIGHGDRKQRRKCKKKALLSYKKLELYKRHCPENFTNKFYLMDAELLLLEGDLDRAAGYYENAIRTAANEKFLQEEAIACECYALALYKHGGERKAGDADQYMNRAMELYDRWGAKAKVSQLMVNVPTKKKDHITAATSETDSF